MAMQMLFRVVIRSEPPNHPEIQAFRHRFDLPCSNGFSFTKVCNSFTQDHVLIFSKVLKSLPGGCESFFVMAYSSHISSFKALWDHLDIAEPTQDEMEAIWQALSDPLLSLATTFMDFLHGRGAFAPGASLLLVFTSLTLWTYSTLEKKASGQNTSAGKQAGCTSGSWEHCQSRWVHIAQDSDWVI